MKRLSVFAVAALLFVAAASYPDEPVQPVRKPAGNPSVGVEYLVLPTQVEIQPGRMTRIGVKTDAKVKVVRWINPNPEDLDMIESETGRWAIVSSPKAGLYRVFVYSAVDGEPTDPVACIIRVGTPGPGPVPPGPVPPDPTPPGPGPTPPEPTPPTPPAPIPDAGFRVLMTYETATVQNLPPEKSAVLYSKKVRDYLDSKCVMGPDNKTREWRIWDQDVDTAGDRAVWQNAMKRPRASSPWIVISNGKTGHEGPLPANVDEALKLLKKYGGE